MTARLVSPGLCLLAMAAVLHSPADANESCSDFSRYGQVLTVSVNQEGLVDYAGLKADRSGLDDAINEFANCLPGVLDKLTEDGQIAFWINVYNAFTLQVIIDHYPIAGGLLGRLAWPENSIRQIPRVWKSFRVHTYARQLSLNDIEHEILRKKFDRPEIHMGLVCASLGCPVLATTPYTGPTLRAQLRSQAIQFLSRPANFAFGPEDNTLSVSSIFDWFGEDFSGYPGAMTMPTDVRGTTPGVLAYLHDHVDADAAERIRAGGFKVQFSDYDWGLNDQATAGE